MKTLFLVGAVFALLFWQAGSLDAKTDNEPNPYRVRKIFLETRTQANGDLSELGMNAFASLRPALKEALSGYGFTVVNDSEDADAVMYGGNTVGWISLDGPPVDPPRYGFQFWLLSSKYDFKWQTEFNIRSRGNESEIGHKAVRKAALNLFRAWKKSAKTLALSL